ncbi:MAG: glycosyltransferase family 4 protein [Solirubrobacterales bacterium]|nr:glycosyltransferase family 4 protein [Solirubrobacterales bacterium]
MAEAPIRPSYARIGVGGAGAAVVLIASLAGLGLEPVARAWMLVAGFSLLTASCLGASRRFAMPAILGVILVVFCGLSAAVSIPEPIETSNARAKTLNAEQVKASTPAKGIESRVSEAGFRYAAKVTGLGGLAAMLAALAAAVLLRSPGDRLRRRPGEIERIGKQLVFIGFLGVAGALVRFILTQLPVEDLFASVKSFWIGGTWLLVVATFAVPGFALWVQGLIGRQATVRQLMIPTTAALAYIALLVPTGQRGFLIALGVMALAILLGNRVIGIKKTAALIAVGVVFIGLTQAVRNEASGTGQITPKGFIERVQPDQWRDLYSSQIASFSWTSLVAQNRSELDIPNSFLALVAKPVPRSIYPEKSQGFGAEFTRRAFPEAAKFDVSFATPLIAESDYNFGPIGVILILGLVGAGCVLADRRLAERAPPLVEPIVAATIFWVLFELVRGDLANALVFSAGWVVPLLIYSRGLGLRRNPRPKRILVDALQVAPKFSGIGRRVAEIGESLKQHPLDLPVEVRCARDVRESLSSSFPEGTVFHTPIRSSRPRVRRILFENLVAPFTTGASTVLFCPGDQAPLWGRSPLILAIHDVRRLASPDSAASRLEAIYYRIVMRSGAARADSIITISEFSRDEIERHLRFDCPVEIIAEQPAGIEPVPTELIETNPARFLVVGALRRYKGLDTAIAALAKAGTDGAGIELVCVGDSESDPAFRDELLAQAQTLGVADRVRFAGWIPDEELLLLYRGSVATINPSRYEGYGLGVAESLAAGLPTIASDIPPHRETGDSAAIYFAPGDEDTLAKLISEIRTNPSIRRDLACRARERHEGLLESDRPWATALRDALGGLSTQTRPNATLDNRRESPPTQPDRDLQPT